MIPARRRNALSRRIVLLPRCRERTSLSSNRAATGRFPLLRLQARVESGLWTQRHNRFATDSPLEGDGFEPSVPGDTPWVPSWKMSIILQSLPAGYPEYDAAGMLCSGSRKREHGLAPLSPCGPSLILGVELALDAFFSFGEGPTVRIRFAPPASHSQQSLLRLQGRLGERRLVPSAAWSCGGPIVSRRIFPE
jgi:hypothetical protein